MIKEFMRSIHFCVTSYRFLYQGKGHGVVDEELHIPVIIRLRQEWAKNIGSSPDWDGSQKQPINGVYALPWPGWKQTIYRLTGFTWFLPPLL